MDNFAEQLLKNAGATNVELPSEAKLLTDRMAEKWKGDDIVCVKNFTKEKIGWVYCDRNGTRIEQPDQYTQHVYQGPQKVRVLEPGKTILIPGWEAYVALNQFYDRWAAMTDPEHLTAFVSSPLRQEEFLGQAFLGVRDVSDLTAEPVDVKKEVEDDLGLSDGKEAEKPATTAKK